MAIPEGYHSVTPYLVVKGAARAIEFYKQAFGATELLRLDGTDGKVGHAEIKIGDPPDHARRRISGDGLSQPGVARRSRGQPHGVRGQRRRSRPAGHRRRSKELRPVQDQFYGARSGTCKIPSATSGLSPPTSKTSLRRSCAGGPRPSSSSRKSPDAAGSGDPGTSGRGGAPVLGCVRRFV